MPTGKAGVGDWIVRLRRRRDGRRYYYRHDGCTTARKESSMRMTEDVAKQLAAAISTHHKDFYAWATRYNTKTPKHRKEAAAAARAAGTTVVTSDTVMCTLVKEPGTDAAPTRAERNKQT